MVPEYSEWPGCPFVPANMTGVANHGLLQWPIYALALLVGKHGVLNHNLPLLLAIPAAFAVLRRSSTHRPELIFALGWCASTWLVYSVLSNNYGGVCCSIRWFVPFLAPAYYLLAIYLKEQPSKLPDFVILSCWGAVLAAIMWWRGPWAPHMVPFLWPIGGGALVSWLIWRLRRRERNTPTLPSPIKGEEKDKHWLAFPPPSWGRVRVGAFS
jgi:hypothetical protein